MTDRVGTPAFRASVSHTLKREGVFANDANDSGGPTLYGVASNIWPEWYDHIASEPDTAKRIEIAIEFYHVNFWEKLHLDELHSTRIAVEIFDTAVNGGLWRAAKIAQQAANLCYKARGYGLFLKEDGVFGPITRKAINDISRKYAENLDGMLNYFQAEFYMSLFDANPAKYGDFIIGWFRRVQTHGDLD